ncbi:MAG TPA: AI-2E family transporter [Candidatus Dojkabacteria bacterium]|nr:AI-2E family transporter [Candidatus Dojkabacteria bacterium]
MPKEYSLKRNKKEIDVIERMDDINIEKMDDVKIVNNNLKVEISLNTIITVLVVIGAIYFGTKLISVIGILFFAFIISSGVLPIVKGLQDKKISKGWSVFIVYAIGILLTIAVTLLIIVPFLSESQSLIQDLPNVAKQTMDRINSIDLFGRKLDSQNIQPYLNSAIDWIKNVTTNGDGLKTAVNAVSTVAGGYLTVITTIILSIYMVVDHDNFTDLLLLRILDEPKRKRVKKLVEDVEGKLGSWLIGQGALCFIIGGMSWVLLVVLKIPFALPLAVFAGLLEAIPSLGPTISAVPAIIIAFISGGPLTALFVMIGYMIIQQLENTLIVPRVMASAVGVKPIIVMTAVISGFTLAGPIGALIAVPVVVLLEIGYQFYLDLQKLRAKGIV